MIDQKSLENTRKINVFEPRGRPRTTRDRPKTAPRPPQDGPRATQDRPRATQDRPRATQDDPRAIQDQARPSQERPRSKKALQDEPFRARTGSALSGRELLRSSEGLLSRNSCLRKSLGHLWNITSHQSETSNKDKKNLANQPKSIQHPVQIDPQTIPNRFKIASGGPKIA